MKKGSTIIESIISMSIVLIALNISVQIFLISSKSILVRKSREKANRISYAIENEIKYNVSFENIERTFINGNLSLKYKENILDTLLTTPVLLLERGNEIIIEEKVNNSIEDDYKITTFKITINDSDGGKLNEREFIKSYWMEV